MPMLSRRSFLASAAVTGAFFIPATRLFGQELKGPASKQLRFAMIGVGGMGDSTRSSIIDGGGTVAALCDVDPRQSAGVAAKYPGIPVYTDYRRLFAERAKDFDAVAIATPDHTHAIIALEAMRHGKHVYVQKPLARTFEECQLMLEAQQRSGLVVQMGNQGHPGVLRYDALVAQGAYGEVLDIQGWSDRPIWPQGMNAYPPAEKIPAGFDWEGWVGPAAMHDYSGKIAPFNWRGYWDYGCGAIGDMAVHNVDPAFWSLHLGLPVAVSAQCSEPVTVAFPRWSIITMKFAPVPLAPKGVTLTWYDGHKLPPVPAGANKELRLADNGLIIHGTRLTTLAGSHARAPFVVAVGGHDWNADSHAVQSEWNKVIKAVKTEDHYRQWVEAAKAGEPERCGSRLSYAAPLTQALLLGCVALRFPGEELRFDPTKRLFTDKPEANAFLKAHERGAYSFAAYRKSPWWKIW